MIRAAKLREPAQDLLSRLTTTPDVFVQKLDLVRSAALLVGVREDEYHAASFLDDRMLSDAMPRQWVGLKTLVDRTEQLEPGHPVHFIFHTGHVGSTLVSRLLDAIDGVFPLREPFVLRQIADAHDVVESPESFLSPQALDKILDVSLRLWSRGFAGTRTVIVKATSSAVRLAPAILQKSAQSRALCLNVGIETYIAALLANPGTLGDLRGHAQERIRRLAGLGVNLQTPLYLMSPGQLAAMGWLVESWGQHLALAAAPQRVIAADFDLLLKNFRDVLRQVLRHFALPHDDQTIALLESSHALTRYSKAPQHDYSPQVRAQKLAESRARNSEEIRKGLRMIERIAARHPVASAVFGRSPRVF